MTEHKFIIIPEHARLFYKGDTPRVGERLDVQIREVECGEVWKDIPISLRVMEVRRTISLTRGTEDEGYHFANVTEILCEER